MVRPAVQVLDRCRNEYVATPLQLSHRPAVHQLLLGAFIQEPLHLRANVSAFPLSPLAFDAEAAFTARYAREVLGATVDVPALDKLRQDGAHARPVIALAVRLTIDASPEQLERNADSDLRRARSVISWAAGEVPEPFAIVTSTLKDVCFRLLAPQSRRRQRLGFGNTGPDYYATLYRIQENAEKDERFAFALTLFRDALRDDSPEFRVARFFSCLEALAYRLKNKDTASRAAVRKLLGLEDGALAMIPIDGSDCQYDRVEVGGRIRDKLFHGVPFDPDELTPDARRAYLHLRQYPEQMRDMLLVDCELAIANWANDTSPGRESSESGPA